jgi:hypothetical protein
MVVDERQLPARQGRLVLAYLIGERSRPATGDELGDAVWSDTLPTAWESALREASEAGPSSAPGGRQKGRNDCTSAFSP